ncbi:MAG: ComEC/Rec2 family competence protein [Candidatus Omnitrophota bacterium]
MNKRPISIIAILFMVGIILASIFFNPTDFVCLFFLTLTSFFISLLLFRKRALSEIFMLVSLIGVGSLFYINSNIFPNNHISNVLKEDTLKTYVVGVIKTPVLNRRPYFGKINSRYVFQIEAVKKENDWLEVGGRGYANIQTESSYDYGDRLLALASIKRPKSKEDFDYRKYLERKNIFFTFNTEENNITLLKKDHRINYFLKFVYNVREKIKDNIISRLPLESGALLRAVLLGDRSEISSHMTDSFKRSGTMHILAISGLHVGLISFILLMFFRIFRVKREVSFGLTILILIFFMFLTLSSPPVFRAVVMACFFLFGLMLGRRADTYNSLSLAALFVLIRNPKDIFNIGFQLSFLAVLSIVYLVPKMLAIANIKKTPFLQKYIVTPFFISLAAWFATFPLIVYHFRIITPISIISNMFIVPVLFMVLVSGSAFILFGWLPIAGIVLTYISNLSINILFYLTDVFSTLRFGHFYL